MRCDSVECAFMQALAVGQMQVEKITFNYCFTDSEAVSISLEWGMVLLDSERQNVSKVDVQFVVVPKRISWLVMPVGFHILSLCLPQLFVFQRA